MFAYWRLANGWRVTTEPAEILARIPYVVNATRAARGLVAQARALPAAEARAQVIGSLGVLDTALIAEATGGTDTTCAAAQNLVTAVDAGAFNPASVSITLRSLVDVRPPRLILLEGVYECATRWFTSDYAGVTSWVKSVGNALGGVLFTIRDQNPSVVAALLQILAAVPIPEMWARGITNANALVELDARLPGSGWAQPSRVTVQALSARAQGRIAQAMTMFPTGGFPMFPDGEGNRVATLPARPRVQWGPILAGGSVGLLAGAMAQVRARRQ